FQKMILWREIVEQFRRFYRHPYSMNIGFSFRRCNSNTDVLQFAAESPHRMPLAMGQHKDRIIIGTNISYNVFVQLQSVLHGKIHFPKLIHNVTWHYCRKTVILYRSPMKLWVLALSAVSRTALDDRPVQLPDQISNQFRMKIIVSAGLTGGDLDSHLSV